MRPPLRTIAAAGALGLAASAPALGAWAPPQRASTGPGDAHSPDVAVNRRGDAAAAWVQVVEGRGTIVASSRPAGGRWSRPERVSDPGLAAIDPAVALTPGGRLIVVWRQADRSRVLLGRRQAVYLARARDRRPDGRWGPQWILSDRRQKVGEPQVVADGRGVVIATWHWGTGTRAGTPGHVGQVQVAEKPVGGGWGRPRRVSRGCALDTRLPDVTAGSGGHAVVWWQCDQAAGRTAFDAAGRGPSPGAWRAARRLPQRVARGSQLALAVAADGTTLGLGIVPAGLPASWRARAPLGRPGALTLDPLALLLPRPVARSGGHSAAAAAGAGGVGAWMQDDGLALADLGRDSVPVTPVPGGGAALVDARIAAATDGSAVVVARSGRRVVAATRPAGGSPTALQAISAAGPVEDAGVAVDGAGRAVACWSRRAGGRSIVERAEWVAR
jgi:hypothetical protein